MAAEREHRVWNNLVPLLPAPDYLLDDQNKRRLEEREVKETGKVAVRKLEERRGVPTTEEASKHNGVLCPRK